MVHHDRPGPARSSRQTIWPASRRDAVQGRLPAGSHEEAGPLRPSLALSVGGRAWLTARCQLRAHELAAERPVAATRTSAIPRTGRDGTTRLVRSGPRGNLIIGFGQVA